jgi:hypothetical protein
VIRLRPLSPCCVGQGGERLMILSLFVLCAEDRCWTRMVQPRGWSFQLQQPIFWVSGVLSHPITDHQ